MKKIIRKLSSMQFAILVLILTGLVSIIGSLIPQNRALEFYHLTYGHGWGDWIDRLGLSRIFTAWWFAALVGVLCLSLFFCVVARVLPLHAAIKRDGIKDNSQRIGSWVLHLGILLTILFFAIGNFTAFQTTVYNVPGTVTKVSGLDLSLQIEDFQVILRDDGSVESYRTTAKILGADDGIRAEGDIEVNHPITVDGYQFTQTSMGYAVDVEVKRAGEVVGTAVLFQGEYVTADSEKFILEMNDLFPEYVMTAEGPRTRSSEMIDPYVLYRVYYEGGLAGTRVHPIEEPISIEEYTYTFTNPRIYTLLTVRKDSFAVATGLSSALLVIGTFIVFYANPKKEETVPTDERMVEIE